MSDFEVRNKITEAILRELGEELKKRIPPGNVFTLLIAILGDNGEMFYISSALREDVIRNMKEFILKQRFETFGGNLTQAIVTDSVDFIESLDDMSIKLQKEGYVKEVYTMPGGHTWTWEKKR